MGDGGPAFPVTNVHNPMNETMLGGWDGMSVRDHVASQAFMFYLAEMREMNNRDVDKAGYDQVEDWAADRAYKAAQAFVDHRDYVLVCDRRDVDHVNHAGTYESEESKQDREAAG